jgi:hypothetical protein
MGDAHRGSGQVVVRSSATGFVQETLADPHRMIADEPLSVLAWTRDCHPRIFYSPRWELALRLRLGCTLAGKDGCSRKLWSVHTLDCTVRNQRGNANEEARRIQVFREVGRPPVELL